MNDEVDIALRDIIRTATSTILMEITTSYWQIRWEWYVPCPVKFPEWKCIFRSFYLSGWLSIFLVVMLANLVIVFLARFGIKEYESFKRFVDAILDVWALILGVYILLATYNRSTNDLLSLGVLLLGNQHSVPGLPHDVSGGSWFREINYKHRRSVYFWNHIRIFFHLL
jgi:hypothetical protein